MGFLPDQYNPVKWYEKGKEAISPYTSQLFGSSPLGTGNIGINPFDALQSYTRGSFGQDYIDPVKRLFGGTPSAQAQTQEQQYETLPTSRQYFDDQGNPTNAQGERLDGGYQYGSTAGGDIYGAEGDTSGGADRLNEQFMATLQEYEDRANRTADELISRAEGDRDFAIRQLDAEHKVALGQNDQERAKFLEQVANKLEERIGTIPYDYKVGVTRLEETKSRALERLARDEAELRRKLGIETEQARQTQGETLSKRGLLTGPRMETVGLGSGEVGRLEDEIEAKFQALERGATEGREDITRTATRGVEDVTSKQRRLALTTGRTYDFGKEQAERDLEAERQRVERQRALAKLDVQAMQFEGAK